MNSIKSLVMAVLVALGTYGPASLAYLSLRYGIGPSWAGFTVALLMVGGTAAVVIFLLKALRGEAPLTGILSKGRGA